MSDALNVSSDYLLGKTDIKNNTKEGVTDMEKEILDSARVNPKLAIRLCRAKYISPETLALIDKVLDAEAEKFVRNREEKRKNANKPREI